MNLERHHQGPAAFDLQHNCIYLARDGAVRCYAKTAAFYMTAGNSPELMDGRTLALYHVIGPRHCIIRSGKCTLRVTKSSSWCRVVSRWNFERGGGAHDTLAVPSCLHRSGRDLASPDCARAVRADCDHDAPQYVHERG